VAIGLIIAIATGFGLAHIEEFNLKKPWLIVTYILVGWMLLIGAVAGKHDRLTRQMAESEIGNSSLSDSLRKRLKDPLNLTLNISMILAIIIVIAMMVFKPGGNDDD
jgi:uncharacterized membrane protein